MLSLKRKRQIITFIKSNTVGLIGYTSKPTFIVIGTQKGGTTALFHYLYSHPQIVGGIRKELHFFDHNYHRGIRWYHSLFPLPHQLRPDKITYEATPKYIFDPLVAARIHAYNPQLKLITILRNPIDRAFSAYSVTYWDKAGYKSFDEMVTGEIEKIAKNGTGYPGAHQVDYLQRGLYADQLERYYALFPRENILVIENSELKNKTAETLTRITTILGLSAFDWSSKEYAPRNQGTYTEPMKPETREKLQEFYHPHNERLYSLLGVDYGWK